MVLHVTLASHLQVGILTMAHIRWLLVFDEHLL